ncbi:MAG: SMC family ATPase [Pseudanabaenaceae cyanobacterium bins.39]|nr:SMC family ATPase [Pseudanabaenaceae cyanobacterium bins.39]
MRPLELIVEGFTSFRSRQAIDFTDLDLFAITGATGAGKTSLLDAITFALYDKVAQKSNSAKELVSQGATQLKVEFRFLMRQSEYRVVRTWRSRGRTDKKECLFEQLVGGDWESRDRQEIEQVIGMDFDTFTRVIILPQGKFDEFLKGEATKRREILRQVAGFQVFEQMRKQASDRSSRLKMERELLDQVLASIQAPTHSEFQSQQKQLQLLESLIPQQEKQIKQCRQLLETEERLLAQIQQQALLLEQLEELESQGEAMQVLEAQLHQAQIANLLVSPWTLWQTAQANYEQAIAECQVANQELETAAAVLVEQQQRYDRCRVEQSASQEQLAKLERNLGLVEALHSQQQQAQLDWQRAEQNWAERSQVAHRASQELCQAKTDLDAITAQLRDIEFQIAAVTSHPNYQPTKLIQLQQIEAPLQQWQSWHREITEKQSRHQQWQSQQRQLLQDLAQQQQQIQQTELVLQEATQAWQEALLVNQQTQQANHVQAIRSEMQDGDICPVCHNAYTVHAVSPLPELVMIEVEPLYQKKVNLEKSLNQQLQSMAKVEANLENVQQQIQSHNLEIEDLTQKLKQVQQQIDRLWQGDWQNLDVISDRESIAAQVQIYQDLTMRQKELELALQNCQNQWQRYQELHGQAIAELQRAEQEKNLRQEQYQEREKQMQVITEGKSYATLQQEISALKVNLSKQIQTTEADYRQARDRHIQCQSVADIATQHYQATQIQAEYQQGIWQSELAKYNLTEPEFLSAQAMRSQMADWQDQIDRYHQQQQELKTRLQMCRESIGDRYTDQAAIAQQQNYLHELEQNLQQSTESRANLKAWLEQAQQKRQESQACEERQKAILAEEQIYYTLAQDLKSDKFQEYILDSLQQELAHRASNLLQQLSDQRYILQIEGGDYWVSDNWNGGDKRRIRTLSGGETFAVSLSMALALSERLSMGIELGSLFLDEGFGTLDGDTLESVTQILESLRQQDRLIGVITHIQSLADRLPAQIHVKKSINGSELVKV